MENQSKYDPNRKTVGAIYRDAQLNNTEDYIQVGDMTRELMSSLVEDINDTLQTKPFGDKPYYITVHEKRDLQMKNAFLRRVITTLYRPWPEDDTVVFWVDPVSNTVKFCWCLPHSSQMDNILANPILYKDQLPEVMAFRAFDLYYFGFLKDEMGNWFANDKFEDKKMEVKKVNLILPNEAIC
jgi:hypothetical protein